MGALLAMIATLRWPAHPVKRKHKRNAEPGAPLAARSGLRLSQEAWTAADPHPLPGAALWKPRAAPPLPLS